MNIFGRTSLAVLGALLAVSAICTPHSLPFSPRSLHNFHGAIVGNQGQSDLVRQDEGKPERRVRTSVKNDAGISWHGRSSDGWDFTASGPVLQSSGLIRFRWSSRRTTDSSAERNGFLDVDPSGRRAKAVLYDDQEKELCAFDGSFAPDRRMVWGYVWDLPDSRPGDPNRAGWWATVEHEPVTAPAGRIAVNSITVAVLEAAGLSPLSARNIVGDRIVLGLYPDLDAVLATPDLSESDRELLKEKADVR